MNSFIQSCKRICLATLIAVPVWGAVTAVLLLLPPIVGFIAGLCGIALLLIGKELERPRILGIGGILAFAGVCAWALQQ
jgi:hypothetical protein